MVIFLKFLTSLKIYSSRLKPHFPSKVLKRWQGNGYVGGKISVCWAITFIFLCVFPFYIVMGWSKCDSILGLVRNNLETELER
uniref:Putative ovule protein n=1 Tax=Solanum chacoense TaxID=4108 RepID=A0A0V0H4A6_SOLCH